MRNDLLESGERRRLELIFIALPLTHTQTHTSTLTPCLSMQKYIDNNENTENELNNFVIESGNPQPVISGKTTFTQTHTHAQTCTHKLNNSFFNWYANYLFSNATLHALERFHSCKFRLISLHPFYIDFQISIRFSFFFSPDASRVAH